MASNGSLDRYYNSLPGLENVAKKLLKIKNGD